MDQMPVLWARLVPAPSFLGALIDKLPPLDMSWPPEVRELWFSCWLGLAAIVSDAAD